MEIALKMFHDKHPTDGLMINVVRHPYSFIGDSQAPPGVVGIWKGPGRWPGYGDVPEGEEPTWGSRMSENGKDGLAKLAAKSGIKMDFDVKANWQPLDSQRVVLWSGRFGKQEEYLSALARLHFEERKSASHRTTVLEAAKEAGLDPAKTEAFLESGELTDRVWQSYKDTIASGIESIPLFVFNRNGNVYGMHGSSSPKQFLELFEEVKKDHDEEASASAPSSARL